MSCDTGKEGVRRRTFRAIKDPTSAFGRENELTKEEKSAGQCLCTLHERIIILLCDALAMKVSKMASVDSYVKHSLIPSWGPRILGYHQVLQLSRFAVLYHPRFSIAYFRLDILKHLE